ncbi:hypothetical protein A6B37_04845 [Achromobacter sp. HZ01]|nr:hypothetical protein A6B37_04845 [Achromobacter sp. HZ01]
MKLYLKQLKEGQFYITDIERARQSEAKMLNILLYEDALLGHSPPDKETTLRYLDIIEKL